MTGVVGGEKSQPVIRVVRCLLTPDPGCSYLVALSFDFEQLDMVSEKQRNFSELFSFPTYFLVHFYILFEK